MSHEKIQQNLRSLRAIFKKEGCHGLLIPKTDPHQNEYLPKNFEQLEWVANFTGSAGMAIVLESKAVLFVDGRYTLQAQKEVDTEAFEIKSLSWKSITDWIEKNLGKDKTLGFDPWLALKSQAELLQKACEKGGGKLLALSANPLDKLIQNREPLPAALLVPHPLKFSGKSVTDKTKEIVDRMQQESVDVLVLSMLDSIAWLLNIRGNDIPFNPVSLAYAFVHSSGKVELFNRCHKLDSKIDFFGNSTSADDLGVEAVLESSCTSMYTAVLRSDSPTNPLPEASFQRGLIKEHLGENILLRKYEDFRAALQGLGKKKVWLDPKTASLGIIQAAQKGGAALYEADDPCILPKALKNEVEIEGARFCHRRDGAAVIQFLAWLEQEVPKRGVTEISAADYLLKCRQQHDFFQQNSFETISATRDHGAIIHYRAQPETNYALKAGDIYLVDSGGQYLDGTTDITRTVALGKAPSKEQKDRFTRVLKGHIALAQARFPQGTTGHQLDALARRHLWEAGLDFAHGTGHGVGSYLNVHEGPQSISSHAVPAPLQPGMIVSNEPGYYKEGSYGIRIESLMAVKESTLKSAKPFYEFEMLTLVPIDLSLLDILLLTTEEIRWLNDYHQKVAEKTAPLLDPFSKQWLISATQKIDFKGL